MTLILRYVHAFDLDSFYCLSSTTSKLSVLKEEVKKQAFLRLKSFAIRPIPSCGCSKHYCGHFSLFDETNQKFTFASFTNPSCFGTEWRRSRYTNIKSLISVISLAPNRNRLTLYSKQVGIHAVFNILTSDHPLLESQILPGINLDIGGKEEVITEFFQKEAK